MCLVLMLAGQIALHLATSEGMCVYGISQKMAEHNLFTTFSTFKEPSTSRVKLKSINIQVFYIIAIFC